jgi:hypothetical protein
VDEVRDLDDAYSATVGSWARAAVSVSSAARPRRSSSEVSRPNRAPPRAAVSARHTAPPPRPAPPNCRPPRDAPPRRSADRPRWVPPTKCIRRRIPTKIRGSTPLKPETIVDDRAIALRDLHKSRRLTRDASSSFQAPVRSRGGGHRSCREADALLTARGPTRNQVFKTLATHQRQGFSRQLYPRAAATDREVCRLPIHGRMDQ